MSAAQFEAPNHWLLAFQNTVFRFLPQKMLGDLGVTKKQLIQLTNSLKQLDLRAQLSQVSLPVLVICGQQDKVNRSASQELAEILPHASLHLISGKHELNKEQPAIFAQQINNFMYD